MKEVPEGRERGAGTVVCRGGVANTQGYYSVCSVELHRPVCTMSKSGWMS